MFIIIIGNLQEIIFSVLVILAYLGTASAAFAAAWGAPPELCETVEEFLEDDPCDRKALTATTALQAVRK